MARRNQSIPATPRVISPSPTPSERDASGQESSSYLGPTTRSAARKRLAVTPQPATDDIDEDDSPDLRRARSRSRSPIDARKLGRLTPRRSSTAANGVKPLAAGSNGYIPEKAAETNGHLSPPTPSVYYGWNWRDFSRSPSPLGLIPIHRHWRTFVHKHEVPRKALHVSIGFFVVWLYLSGTQTSAVCPYLMGALIPIAAVDVLRHHYAPFNRLYVKVLGALMRESEFSGYNGVIFYLLGAWAVLYFFPKDVGVMGTLLLSWCDTAASTFGRLYGRYTPRIRRGKSLAGSLAAFIVGVGTSVYFWGWLAPTKGPFPGDENFMFTGSLGLPRVLADAVGLAPEKATVSGGLALGIMSVWSGFVAAASEVVDLFGWDDNLTIPVLSGLGIWGFLKFFG
ncbi:Diacylglycerol kinase [Madurella fahalii]|uniref:Diacylglycerol kinase n=1 Tax=Madurella fahalii TaxID=1157608 RepID=A0ABQ0G703_9PEZI